MLDAAADGAIDFSEAQISDFRWHRKLKLLINAYDRKRTREARTLMAVVTSQNARTSDLLSLAENSTREAILLMLNRDIEEKKEVKLTPEEEYKLVTGVDLNEDRAKLLEKSQNRLSKSFPTKNIGFKRNKG